MADPVPLICVGRDRDPHVPSTATRCVGCGAELWVSTAMVPSLVAGETVPTCSTCGGLFDDVAIAGIHPAQRGDLAAHGVLGAAEDLVVRLNQGGDR